MSSKPTNPPTQGESNIEDENASIIEDITPDWVELPIKTKIHQSFSFPSYKRNNFHFIEKNRLVSTVGNTLHFININGALSAKENSQESQATFEWFLNENGTTDGIGAICVSTPNFIKFNHENLSQSNKILLQLKRIESR